MTIWIDPALDEQMRPLPLNSNDNVNDIDIYWNSQYEFMKDFNEEHQVGKDDYLEKLNEIRIPFIQLAEKAIEFFSQYQQSSIEEATLISSMQNLASEADQLYFRSGNLPFAPPDCLDFKQVCQNIFSAIHDMFLYYSEQGLKRWTQPNRDNLMKKTISRFREELAKLEYEEKKIH